MWDCASGSDHLRNSASFLTECPPFSRLARRNKVSKPLPSLGREIWQYSYYVFCFSGWASCLDLISEANRILNIFLVFCTLHCETFM